MISVDLSEKMVTGKGNFVDDINLPGMLHLAFVRSPYPRARIKSIKGGITSRDIDMKMASVGEGASAGFEYLEHPVLAKEYVGYVGQPVAAVYSENAYEAEDLVDTVGVDYEPLTAIVDPEKAMSAEPMYPGLKSNILADRYLGEDFQVDAPVVIEGHFVNHRIATDPIEPRGIVAAYDGKRLTVWISTQSVHTIKQGFCEVMKLSPDAVRVIQTDTGGAFGLKGGFYPEYVVAAWLAMKEGRPVKWIETRSEHLLASRPGRGVVGRMKLYANRQGRILGIKGDVIVDSGAFAGGSGEFSSRFIAMQITGPYEINNAHIHALSVLTNKVPQGPYRGAGRPEAAFFMERMVDRLADELHMDPVDVRMINATREPFVSPTGLTVEASKPFLEQAVKAMDYNGHRKKGNVGFGWFVLVPATMPGETARIFVENRGIKVWLGGTAHGQRHDLFVKSILADELGVDPEIVEWQKGDTDQLKEGVGAWGSRSAMMGGSALVEAARKLKEQVEKKYGKYSVARLLDGKWDSYEYFHYDKPYTSLGANLITVSTDRYGRVKVDECISYYDLGKVLNMDNATGQNAGGCAEGIGQTLYEGLMFDQNGQMITSSIADAGVVKATMVPRYRLILHSSESTLPSKAKGLGEAPTIGTPVALSRAIEVATGLRITDTPINPEYLISAVREP